jgi:DNA-binding IclR family transcriptional regulator
MQMNAVNAQVLNSLVRAARQGRSASPEQLARQLGRSIAQVQRSLNEFEAAGLARRAPRLGPTLTGFAIGSALLSQAARPQQKASRPRQLAA